MIDPTQPPFSLDGGAMAWVHATLADLTLEQKVGQLFTLVVMNPDPEVNLATIREAGIEPGGFMARPFAKTAVQDLHRALQDASRVPLLLAANLERGGDGLTVEGTTVGTQYGVAATDDETHAYRLGLVAGREGAAVGCNWAFAPVIDLDLNPANPITNTRTYGSDPERVLRMAKAYMRGIHEAGLAVSIKHWPGDGVDGRDQHISTSVNSLTVEQWEAGFGAVYRGMIDAGAATVMAAHIMQPAWSRELRPGIADADILPASLAPELTIDLLRGRLGFNGLVTTDATVMTGMTAVMPRSQAVPASIMAGCDVFLFTGNLAQDFGFMLAGVRSRGVDRGAAGRGGHHDPGVQGVARPASQAGRRHSRARTRGTRRDRLRRAPAVGQGVRRGRRHVGQGPRGAAAAVARDAPQGAALRAGGHRRVRGLGGRRCVGPVRRAAPRCRFRRARVRLRRPDRVRQRDTLMDPLGLVAGYDLVLYLASLKTASNQTVVRLTWGIPFGFDSPRVVEDVPTVFVSIDNPYHLQDVATVKTFVNGYTSTPTVVDAVVDRLLGLAPFTGISPADPFCGLWDAKR